MKVVSIGTIANDGVDYELWLSRPYSQPGMNVEHTARTGRDSVVTSQRRNALAMNLNCRIYGADNAETEMLREALLAALDTETSAIALVVADDDGGNERYRYVVCRITDEQAEGDGTGQHLVATLMTHIESRWRSTTPSSTTWNVTASGDTTVIANGGSLPARATYTIQPTSANTTKFSYRRFCAVTWEGRAATWWPVDVSTFEFDTDALITAGKISGEDNIAVAVDGALRKRWISRYDTTLTSVWVNLDWIYCPSVGVLDGHGFGSGDTVTEIVADQPINLFPFQGMLWIEQEVFLYTGKREEDNTFTGVTRAAKGSAAVEVFGGKYDDDTPISPIYLLQHDIWLLYGGGGTFTNDMDKTGPTIESAQGIDTLKPMFDLDTSNNSEWKFEYFGESGPENRHRPGSWRAPRANTSSVIGDPFDLLAVNTSSPNVRQSGWWQLATPHRLVAARIIGFVTFTQVGASWDVGLRTVAPGGELTDYITLPSSAMISPLSFDASQTLTSWWSDTVRFYAQSENDITAMLDIINLTWMNGPVATVGDEQSLYDMDLLLENVTTGKSITLAGQIQLNEHLVVNTEQYTVINLDDSTSQYQMLERSTRRREILPLQPGNNTLRVTEDGLAGMTITIEFEERSYS